MAAFGDILLGFIVSRLGSQSAFARAIGRSSAFVNQICRSKRTPPLDEVESWAKTLSLSGLDRERFINLAALAHLPRPVAERFESLLDEHYRQGAELAELQALVTERLGIELPGARVAEEEQEALPAKTFRTRSTTWDSNSLYRTKPDAKRKDKP